MKRDVPFTAAILLLCIVLLMLSMVLWQRSIRAAEEAGQLREQIAQADSPHEGGMDIEPPAIPESTEQYRFPIAPEDYRMLTSPYGYRKSPLLAVERYHAGVDIAAAWRAQVVAVADGVVVEHWPPPDGYYRGHDVYGGMVVIEHADGWRSLYAHLSSTRVHTGWTVRAGEVIGRIGNTGKSDGAHLHVEIHGPDGAAVNPLLYLESVE